MSEPRRIRRFARNRRRRKLWITALTVVAALVAATPFLLDRLPVEARPLDTLHSRIFGEFRQIAASENPGGETGNVAGGTTNDSPGGPGFLGRGAFGSRDDAEDSAPEIPLVQPSPAAAAYAAVAPALPGVEPSSVGSTFQSTGDPSWAVTEIEAPDRDGAYTVYSKKVEEGWEARRSVLANDPDYARKGRAPLVDLPEELRASLYPDLEKAPDPGGSPQETARELAAKSPYLGDGWSPVSLRSTGDFARVRMEEKGSEAYTHAYLQRFEGTWYTLGLGRSLTSAELSAFPESLVQPGSLPEAGPATVPVAEPVLEGVPRDRREEVEEGLEEVRETVEDYEGTAGVYVQDGGGWGYGIRPDERFYAASVIKVPIMAAVYRRVESGQLSLDETVATEDRDYAGGAGGLQWQEESVSHTISDYLWMMVEQSDNVATNVLVRTVGGPRYVNEVAADLGAEDTRLQHKVTDQRAAAPGLDNYTTPRDMANVFEAIATGEAANEGHTEAMLGLMQENRPDSWLGQGFPQETAAACKTGWIGGVYNEVCLVQAGDEPYVISAFSKYGPKSVVEGSSMLEEVSSEVWEIQEEKEEPEEEPEEKSGEDESGKDEPGNGEG